MGIRVGASAAGTTATWRGVDPRVDWQRRTMVTAGSTGGDGGCRTGEGATLSAGARSRAVNGGHEVEEKAGVRAPCVNDCRGGEMVCRPLLGRKIRFFFNYFPN